MFCDKFYKYYKRIVETNTRTSNRELLYFAIFHRRITAERYFFAM